MENLLGEGPLRYQEWGKRSRLPFSSFPPIWAIIARFSAKRFKMSENNPSWHGTTILLVRKNGRVVLAGDGQVSVGPTVMKANARKVRRIGAQGEILVGFAGATADAFTLLERLEGKLEKHPGQLTRACVELAKADKDVSLVLTGQGDVLEPSDGLIGIGSGGNYALAAARALIDMDVDAETIAKKAMAVAAEICVYTNTNVIIESL
jgi:ATP-dependent HslUV protease, peptidase subunit HslV